MDYESELKRIANLYTAQGYQVVLRPKSEDLPLFAKSFKVEIVGKRAEEGVLVSVKKNRQEMETDTEMPRYAEVTGSQLGWRFDFVILESESPMGRRGSGGRELLEGDIRQNNLFIAAIAKSGKPEFVKSAFLSAWANLEAAMRFRLRAAGQKVGWGAIPHEMLNELFSAGSFSSDEFFRLELASRLRTEAAHGFDVPDVDEGIVLFLAEMADRLLDESHTAMQPS